LGPAALFEPAFKPELRIRKSQKRNPNQQVSDTVNAGSGQPVPNPDF
jgi:hypothetical protein